MALKSSAILETALKLCSMGYAVHWLRPRSKAPVEGKWSERPVATPDELISTYRTGFNVGIRLGSWCTPIPDHGVIVTDIDVKDETYRSDPYETLHRYMDPPEFFEVQSGSCQFARHLWFTCRLDKLPAKANTVLAKSKEMITLADGSSKHTWMIEVLSTGKQLVIPPSIHPDSGMPYVWLNDIDKPLPLIPDTLLDAIQEEAEDVFAAAVPVTHAEPKRIVPERPTRRFAHRGSVADAFSAAVPWSAILEPHGWRITGERGQYQHWIRPGKKGGDVSATVIEGDVFYVFTTSSTFKPNKGYTKFGAFAVLEHGGNQCAAAKQLLSMVR